MLALQRTVLGLKFVLVQRAAAISRSHSPAASRGGASSRWVLGLAMGLYLHPVMAADSSPELIQPPICSAATAGEPALSGTCAVTPLGNGHNEVKVGLTAKTAPIKVGGYNVVTENYNANYLTPVIEVMPGDTVAAHLVNTLAPRSPEPGHQMMHGDADENPTNLHYFHGGIVSPNNARPKRAELGNGDNVYVRLKNGQSEGPQNTFDFDVPIPGEQMLDARVLEERGYIAHPLGLNWYHSHMHGISSDQVMGGMSGLLSIGDAVANVKAACREDPNNKSKCLNDIEDDTKFLKDHTEVRYTLLRDIALRKISQRPDQADGATAEWAPEDRDFPVDKPCGVWKVDDTGLDTDNVKLRTGFCQHDRDVATLFTLNGQRFPTITVEGGRNLLLRLGNLSANVGYWLELYNEADGTVLPLTILSLDGVVPVKPVPPGETEKPINAFNINNVLLMPATRAELYVRNDNKPHTSPNVYVLRTKGLRNIGSDEWPEIQLARIVLKPNAIASTVPVGLNAPVATLSPFLQAHALVRENATLPDGCVRDLDPSFNEYRRVTFIDGGQTSEGIRTNWSVMAELIRPPAEPGLMDEGDLIPANPMETSVALGLNDGSVRGVPFEEYVQKDGLIDWTKRHVCVLIDHGSHNGSHKQLWVLFNGTDTLHNFHIHQMKFRLATQKELEEHRIMPPLPSDSCGPSPSECLQPNYRFYDNQEPIPGGAEWHDTMPVPPFSKVFIIMSFDAKQQIGRFVFHCHILKHEDNGLMAPIEVWEPTAGSLLQ
jgi:FtsP/CotA-like multicopper oxidase with cupredoxin domain